MNKSDERTVIREADVSCLDIFKFDPQFLGNEEKYKEIKAEILGEDSDEESGSGSEEDSDEDIR